MPSADPRIGQLTSFLEYLASGAAFLLYPGARRSFDDRARALLDMVIVVISSAVPFVQSGRMRALAILDNKRNSSIPDVQTSKEAGLPGLIAINWYTIMVPAGTPRGIIDRLNNESVKAMSAPDMREKFAAMGGDVATGTPEQTGEFLRAENDRWGKVIREANIKAE
jgi:tripartite-type tricarboxylate transporter receptor subunit TctC